MDFQMGGKGLGYADPLFPGTFCGDRAEFGAEEGT